jgi:hypothetical protein
MIPADKILTNQYTQGNEYIFPKTGKYYQGYYCIVTNTKYYTGKTYIIIDNEDKQGDEYRKVFGKEMVIEFDKAAIGKTFDIADTRTDRRATVYARNASFQIAKDLGLDYFMQLDDDYKTFMYRFIDGKQLRGLVTRSLDNVIDAFIKLLVYN